MLTSREYDLLREAFDNYLVALDGNQDEEIGEAIDELVARCEALKLARRRVQ